MTSTPFPQPLAGVPAAAGSLPPASPLLANAWLMAWHRIGGAVTIGLDESVTPWFHPKLGCADRATATCLLTQLVDTPGLPTAVRIIVAGMVRRPRRRIGR